MKKILLILIVVIVGFAIYKNNQKKSEEELLRSEVEHQVKDAFEQLGNEMFSADSRSTKKSPPKNAPTIYSKKVCKDVRNSCSQITNLKRNAPPNTKFDASFNDGVSWCEYVLPECQSRNL